MAQEHPLLAERIEFRRYLRAKGAAIAPVHMHVGCLLEVDELFGFVGVWDGQTRTLSFWADDHDAQVAGGEAADGARPPAMLTGHSDAPNASRRP